MSSTTVSHPAATSAIAATIATRMEPVMRPDQLIRRRLFRKLAQLLGDRTAATAVEFAVLAPVFFLAIIGIIELGVLLAVQVLLEGSVREASRFGITGYTP